MSGICGIVDIAGADVDLSQLALMTGPLERRGPDGTHHWQDGPAALGHTLLATTPEAVVEILPLCDTGSGCVITADVRLDNREILMPAVGLDQTSRIVGDGELILASYLLWGDNCVDHFLGDFAFAIWDPRSSRLFCARDQLGMRQLIYCHKAGSIFAFATEPKAILELDQIPYQVNEERIAAFLEDLEEFDYTSTLFTNIYRLPPAHTLTLDAHGLQIKRYWTLTPGPELDLPNNEAYAEAFLDVFTKAVRCRLRCNGPVGSMLSGGLDSSSVVAVASKLLADVGHGPLQTFSALGPDANACIETKAIHAALTLSGINKHLIDHADLSELMPELITLMEQIDEPFDGKMTLIRAIYLSAHRANVKVMLDGVAGDIVLTEGRQFDILLRTGRWLQALRHANGKKRFWGGEYGSTWKTLAGGVWRLCAPKRLQLFRRRIIVSKSLSETSLINPDFANKFDLKMRHEEVRAHSTGPRLAYAKERANSIVSPVLTVGRERYDRLASAQSIEPRDPFMDLRVVNFCLSLPGDQLQADGWPKLILRRAMRGRLPDVIRWRLGRQHLGWKFSQALLERWPNQCEVASWVAQFPDHIVEKNVIDAVFRRDEEKVCLEKQAEVWFVLTWWDAILKRHR